MPTAVAPLARQVAERAQKDSRFAEVLDAILEAPTEPHGTLQRIAALKPDLAVVDLTRKPTEMPPRSLV